MDNAYEPTSAVPARNTFLTVLCILTFIGSGWGVLGGIYSYVTADAKAEQNRIAMEKVEDRMEGKEQPAFVKYALSGAKMTADDLRKSNIVSVLSCFLTLTGAILMFTLRKNGFYLYIAGIVISIVGPILLFGTGFLGIVGTVISTVVGVAFITMYGVNTRYMTNLIIFC